MIIEYVTFENVHDSILSTIRTFRPIGVPVNIRIYFGLDALRYCFVEGHCSRTQIEIQNL